MENGNIIVIKPLVEIKYPLPFEDIKDGRKIKAMVDISILAVNYFWFNSIVSKSGEELTRDLNNLYDILDKLASNGWKLDEGPLMNYFKANMQNIIDFGNLMIEFVKPI